MRLSYCEKSVFKIIDDEWISFGKHVWPRLFNQVMEMTLCARCGRDNRQDSKVCMYCGEPVSVSTLSSFRMPNNHRKILIGILVLDLIVVSSLMFYMLRPQVAPLITTPLPSMTQGTTSQPTPVPSPTSPSTSSSMPNQTSPIIEETRIKDVLATYFEALNQHSTERATGLFTDNVEILINHGRDYTYQGPKEGLKQYLGTLFSLAPDARVSNASLTSLDIHEDRATVEGKFYVYSKAYNLSRQVTQYFELVERDNLWKIAKTDIVY